MSPPPEPTGIPARFAWAAGVCLALGALVFASRLWLLQAWGTPVPYWDQWDAEGPLYRAWLTGSLDWRQLFAAHNEHRIVLTRLADLALLELGGGWSLWAQLGLNAALHAATAGLLAAGFWPALAPRARISWIAGLAALFCTVAGWQNALWGFQSQVYFTELFGLLGITLVAAVPPWALRWWIGWSALVLACFGTAGGTLAAVAAFAAAQPDRRGLRGRWPLLAIGLVVGLGLALQVSAPHHAALRAQDAGQFLRVLARGLSWPLADSSWAWIVVQLPLLVLWIDRRRRGVRCDPAERCALALAVFAALHVAAVAYSRGAGLPDARLLSRYQDPLHLGLAAQLFALLRLATERGRPGRLAALGWSAVVFAGLLALTYHALITHLPFKRAQDEAGLDNIRTYLQARDPRMFPPPSPFASPHPDPAAVIRVLDDPVLQPILPRQFFQPEPPPLLIHVAPWLVPASAFALCLALGLGFRAARPIALRTASP